jgi:hypothetical protein
MTILSKYEKLTRIYESESSLVYKATKIKDGQTLILKVLKNGSPPDVRIKHKRTFRHLITKCQIVQTVTQKIKMWSKMVLFII